MTIVKTDKRNRISRSGERKKQNQSYLKSQHISRLQNKTLNSRWVAFWQCYQVKQTSEVYISTKFVPQITENEKNERKEKMKVRTIISVEKFKS